MRTVAERKDIGLLIERVVAPRVRAQGVLDQREHVLVLLVAVRIGSLADCDDLTTELLGLVTVAPARAHELRKLRVPQTPLLR